MDHITCPTAIIELTPQGLKIDLMAWNGVNPNMIERMMHELHMASHKYRAANAPKLERQPRSEELPITDKEQANV